MSASQPLLTLALGLHARLDQQRNKGVVALTGNDLDVASVVAIARHGCLPAIEDAKILDRLAKQTSKPTGEAHGGLNTIYGVHTGFGGSADTRPNDTNDVQRGLMQLLHAGIMTDASSSTLDRGASQASESSCMPASWTKATTAVRVNQCIRGHSATQPSTVTTLLKLISSGITPLVPLRGSISASGDLMPLSYIAGILEGNPDLFVTIKQGSAPSRVINARDALIEVGLKPHKLGAREALGLVNGTAASAATASLAILDAMHLMLLTTAVTCLSSEALAGRVEWLHPFIHDTRPHPGQREVADIVRSLLSGSRLVSGLTGADPDDLRKPVLSVRPDGGLPQDRYPLRTSPQWLGPSFEDILLAYNQISVELNSTSDNPLFDPATDTFHHGGNFQAVSVTSAVEKIRTALLMAGRLIFSQCTEMVNHHMSAGLPPNLAPDDPSASFCCKGLDISMAAYLSELSFLSNSMTNHVQSAEMHNQAINSIALIAARYTLQAVELLGMMTAAALFMTCQAIDLRVMHVTFLELARSALGKTCGQMLPNGFRAQHIESSLPTALQAFETTWWQTASSDAAERCMTSALAFTTALADLSRPGGSRAGSRLPRTDYINMTADEMRQLSHNLQGHLLCVYTAHRDAFIAEPTTGDFIGAGSRALYSFVRRDLGIPMHAGLEDHPVLRHDVDGGESDGKLTIGSQVSRIYEAVRDGRVFARFAEVSRDLGVADA